MRNEASGDQPLGQDRGMRLHAAAWQALIVLTFLGLFWGLASVSPWTDRSNRLNLIVGATLLGSAWLVALILAMTTRGSRPRSIRHLVGENPQIWIVAIYVILSARDLIVIPMCDNAAYFKGILDAVRQFNFVLGDSLRAMKLSGHPAQAYAAYMMLGQFLDYAHFPIANIESRALNAMGILAFSGIAGYLFPGQDRRWERLLATALFAFTPLVFGLSLTISPDFGVMVFLGATLYCILRDYPILAVASGVMLSFSKESGALLYASLLGSVFGILLPYRVIHAAGSRVRAYVGGATRLLHLTIPLILYGLYIVYDGQLWTFQSPQGVVAAIGAMPFDFATIYDKSIQIFIASFNWLVWGLSGLGALVGLYRLRRAWPKRPEATGQGVWFVVLVVMLLPFLVVNYTFVTWNNARYILPIAPIAVLLLVKGVESLTQRTRLRLGLLAVCLGLFLVSSFRTVDPLLLRLFGTFRLGDHRMSFYNSQATLCDLSFYNREYVYYNRLFDQFLRQSNFNPNQDEFVFFTQNVYWILANHNIAYLWTGNEVTGPVYVDPRTMTRTFDPAGNARLKSSIFVKGSIDPSELPKHAYSVQLFWIRKLRDLSDAQMRDYYDVVREIHVEEDGYFLDGYELVRRK